VALQEEGRDVTSQWHSRIATFGANGICRECLPSTTVRSMDAMPILFNVKSQKILDKIVWKNIERRKAFRAKHLG